MGIVDYTKLASTGKSIVSLDVKTSEVQLGPPPSPNRTEYPYQASAQFKGLSIYIENLKGQVREGKDPKGKPWSITMANHYGEIPRTAGADGDPIDVFLGDDEDSDLVYVVHQMKAPDFKLYDEDKVMLGFKSAAEAKEAYLSNYNNKRFYGSMTVLGIEDFKELIGRKGVRGKQLSLALFNKEAVVRPEVKAMRRAMELLQKGDHAWHGTKPDKLRTILEQKTIKPGYHNAYSNGIREVYYGIGAPADGYMSSKRTGAGIILPVKDVPNLRIVKSPQKSWLSSDNWGMTATPTPIPEKSYAVVPEQQNDIPEGYLGNLLRINRMRRLTPTDVTNAQYALKGLS